MIAQAMGLSVQRPPPLIVGTAYIHPAQGEKQQEPRTTAIASQERQSASTKSSVILERIFSCL